MKPVPFPARPIPDEEWMELNRLIRGAIFYVDDATPDFQRFHRRLRKLHLAVSADKVGGVVVGASWKKLTPLRLLVMKMIVRHRPAKEYYYALQSNRDGTLAAWNELAAEARYWEREMKESVDRETMWVARRALEKAHRQMARGRGTSYGWVP